MTDLATDHRTEADDAAAPSQKRTRPAPAVAVRFLGIGTALPAARLTNADLERRLDTNDTWIRERTGIRSRRIAGEDDTTARLATIAGRRALDDAGLAAGDIDLVILATATPDTPCPATASRVAEALGTRGAAFDLDAACSGFVYALHVGSLLAAGPGVERVLVIGADRFTSLIDPDDRSTAVLFGDGAGAVVIGALAPDDAAARHAGGAPAPGVLSVDLGGDPGGADVLHVPAGSEHVVMDGPELFRRATRAIASSATAALELAGATPDDVDLFVPHQANVRIIDAAAKRLGVPPERTMVNLADLGNTSAASIPLALADARAAGRMPEGTQVLLVGIGAGLAWASCFVRWSA